MKILNVGCGEDTYGTHRMDVIKRSNVTHIGSCDKPLPFGDNYFDEVYAKSIYEHLENPISFLRECKRVLKKGGKLKLWTDNGNCIIFLYNMTMTKHGDYSGIGGVDSEKDRHFQFFQPEHIRNALVRVGFNSINITLIRDLNWKTLPKKQKFFRIIMGMFGKRFGCPQFMQRL